MFLAASSLCTHRRREGKRMRSASLFISSWGHFKGIWMGKMWEVVLLRESSIRKNDGRDDRWILANKTFYFSTSVHLHIAPGRPALPLVSSPHFSLHRSLEMIFHPRIIRKCHWNLSSQHKHHIKRCQVKLQAVFMYLSCFGIMLLFFWTNECCHWMIE